MHQNPPPKRSISWDGVKPTPGRRCLIKTRVRNCEWTFFHMTRVPVLSSLFTRGAWRDIWWLNNFLQANTSSRDVSLVGGCLKKNVYLQRHHVVQFTWSTVTHRHISHFNNKSAICSLGTKRAKNVSDKTTDLFLIPQTLDFTGSCWQHWNELDIAPTSYSTATMAEWL